MLGNAWELAGTTCAAKSCEAGFPWTRQPTARTPGQVLQLVGQLEATFARMVFVAIGPAIAFALWLVLNRTGQPGGLSRKQVEEALKMKVDVSIPDLPRQVGNAATLGEPVMVSSTGFRNGVVDIVRQVASIRLLDGGQASSSPMARQGKRGLFSLFRRSA